jgi:hypothetical protein
MALINDPNITRQIRDLAGTGTLDTTQIVNLLNSVLPAGQQVSDGFGVTTGVYKRFGEFDKVNAKIEVVTTGLWSGDSGSLNLIYSSSTQTAQTSGQYYYNVYDKNPQTDSSAEVQFAVAYGHVNGSGSITLANDDNSLLASKATYAQYRSMLLDPTDTKFSFVNSAGVSTDSNSVYVINLSRSRYREKMDAGNWSLSLSGSNGMFTFIDNSGKKFSDENGLSGRVFRVVSGSLNLGTENEATVNTTTDVTSGEGFGLFYPDRGIIVLNPTALGNTVGTVYDDNWNSVGSLAGNLGVSTEQYNHKRLYHAIRAGGKVSVGFGGQYGFEARRTENVSTQHFFVRATNREFNYSNNPTYVNADGTFVETTFKTDPYTYITTVGLLSDANEVLAIAKTSQPIAKSFDKEVLIKVKLSF